MTSKAHIREDWVRDTVALAVIRDERGYRQALQWDVSGVRDVSGEATGRYEEAADWLHLREDDARAIYEALADHFGHNGHDVRSLRKDYDAERGRVDLLIKNLIGGAR